jgi:membrane protein involved in colicin uptake
LTSKGRRSFYSELDKLEISLVDAVEATGSRVVSQVNQHSDSNLEALKTFVNEKFNETNKKIDKTNTNVDNMRCGNTDDLTDVGPDALMACKRKGVRNNRDEIATIKLIKEVMKQGGISAQEAQRIVENDMKDPNSALGAAKAEAAKKKEDLETAKKEKKKKAEAAKAEAKKKKDERDAAAATKKAAKMEAERKKQEQKASAAAAPAPAATESSSSFSSAPAAKVASKKKGVETLQATALLAKYMKQPTVNGAEVPEVPEEPL